MAHKIRAIDQAIVKFEFLRKPTIIQCRRCQRFNHSASNCSLPYRYVKCTKSHEPGNCLSTKNNKFKPKCFNCNGDHTANNAKECKVFKEVIASRENKKKTATTTTTVKNKSSLRSTQSYADNLKSTMQQKPSNSNQSTNVDAFIKNQNKMMSDFMAMIQKMQQQFISTFANRNGQ